MSSTTGEEIHICGWMHPKGTSCPPYQPEVEPDGLGDEAKWPEHTIPPTAHPTLPLNEDRDGNKYYMPPQRDIP